MNYLTKIDNLLDSLIEKKLSQIVISAIPIALEIKDYDSWFILRSMTIGKNMATGSGITINDQYIEQG